MKLKTIFKTILIGISYYSFKKVIDRIPEPYRKIVVLTFRACVFFIIFLSLFSFLTSRVNAISENVNLSDLIANIFIGIIFFISLVIGFLLTAVLEEIYRKLSEIKVSAEQKIDSVRGKVKVPLEKVKESVGVTTRAIKKTGTFAKESLKSMYYTSEKITSAAVDNASVLFKRIFRKRKRSTREDENRDDTN